MTEAESHAQMIGRRGDLLAELLLHEFNPAFVARATDELGYDFFMGVPNAKGGINITAVQVKATEKRVSPRYRIGRSLYQSLANSNVPVLLLVVDVKRNQLFYALPDRVQSRDHGTAETVLVHLNEIDDDVKEELRSRLAALPAPELVGSAET
jgi:hypothetical protein